MERLLRMGGGAGLQQVGNCAAEQGALSPGPYEVNLRFRHNKLGKFSRDLLVLMYELQIPEFG